MRILVVGAGVIGLTCAVRLAEADHDVHVIARDLPLETTSAIAAAWWYPYLALPYDRVGTWSARTFETFSELAGDLDCVQMRSSRELLREKTPDPWWINAVPELRRLHDLPTGYLDGWGFDGPVIEMDRYLPYLANRLEAAGGSITRMALSRLPDGADAVVNAAGLANRALVGDHSLYPVRGQVVRVAQCGVEEVWLADTAPDGPTYIVPRTRDVIVGGTEQRGDWNGDPDPATARRIIERASALVPALRTAEILAHRVGLRPARTQVRLETVRRVDASPVVHCYGHGGAGVTLSWGCADEVFQHVEALEP